MLCERFYLIHRLVVPVMGGTKSNGYKVIPYTTFPKVPGLETKPNQTKSGRNSDNSTNGQEHF